MECKFAYLKQNIDYVLCRKEPEPNPIDRKSVAHAVCVHQEHCPKTNCHKLTSGWVGCLKLQIVPQKEPEMAQESVSVPERETAPSEKKTRRKAQEA